MEQMTHSGLGIKHSTQEFTKNKSLKSSQIKEMKKIKINEIDNKEKVRKITKTESWFTGIQIQ